MRQRFQSTSKNAILHTNLWYFKTLKISVPKIGDKRKLVELSYRNAKHLQMERLRKIENVKNREHNKRLMEQMQSDLYLKAKPLHIECFDNSTYKVVILSPVWYLKTGDLVRKNIAFQY